MCGLSQPNIWEFMSGLLRVRLELGCGASHNLVCGQLRSALNKNSSHSGCCDYRAPTAMKGEGPLRPHRQLSTSSTKRWRRRHKGAHWRASSTRRYVDRRVLHCHNYRNLIASSYSSKVWSEDPRLAYDRRPEIALLAPGHLPWNDQQKEKHLQTLPSE